ncbi:hypothetical protein [Luteipulveratus mongoliensis]|nr:hypothetical protein [Luteipulveratus mongoliensis]
MPIDTAVKGRAWILPVGSPAPTLADLHSARFHPALFRKERHEGT